jgi:hypothetical protein
MDTTDRRTSIPATFVIAGVLLALFLALPWLFMGGRAMGMPEWTTGVMPMMGWMRLWALIPVWLLLGAIVLLLMTIRRQGGVR